eukprot:1045735-Prymnesium_polylepis.2
MHPKGCRSVPRRYKSTRDGAWGVVPFHRLVYGFNLYVHAATHCPARRWAILPKEDEPDLSHSLSPRRLTCSVSRFQSADLCLASALCLWGTRADRAECPDVTSASTDP